MNTVPTEERAPGRGGRCAVVYNPVKVSDDFVERAGRALAHHGWVDPLWLSTTVEDPGRGMVREAVAAGVDLLIAAGGDGTVRICADGLARTGIPLGIVPSGTGNLLARNLGIPLEEQQALDVACGGHRRVIDLIKVTVDGGAERSEHFAVMAGAGVDAMIMDETDPDLKDKIGSAAYFLAAGKALGRLPMKSRITIDGHRPRRRQAIVVVVGNVGMLQANIVLIPGAQPDDGRLDVLVAAPRRLLDWVKLVGRLLLRRRRSDQAVEMIAARRVRVQVQERENYQLDGDVAGSFADMVMEVQPGVLPVLVPPPSGDR